MLFSVPAFQPHGVQLHAVSNHLFKCWERCILPRFHLRAGSTPPSMDHIQLFLLY